MDEGQFDKEVLGKVPMDRRQFVKRVAITTAFVTPVVASFSMDGLTMNQAGAVTLSSYSTAKVKGSKKK